jgi:hypothetical protein
MAAIRAGKHVLCEKPFAAKGQEARAVADMASGSGKGRLRGVPLRLSSGLEISFPLAFNEGGAKSDVWRRIITDVIGVPSTLIKDRTGAPLGDAMLLEP